MTVCNKSNGKTNDGFEEHVFTQASKNLLVVSTMSALSQTNESHVFEEASPENQGATPMP